MGAYSPAAFRPWPAASNYLPAADDSTQNLVDTAPAEVDSAASDSAELALPIRAAVRSALGREEPEQADPAREAAR